MINIFIIFLFFTSPSGPRRKYSSCSFPKLSLLLTYLFILLSLSMWILYFSIIFINEYMCSIIIYVIIKHTKISCSSSYHTYFLDKGIILYRIFYIFVFFSCFCGPGGPRRVIGGFSLRERGGEAPELYSLFSEDV